MTPPEPKASARTYVTEIWCPPADSGMHALHSRMPEPEPLPQPEPEAEWDSADSNAYQARVEVAGLEPEAGL